MTEYLPLLPVCGVMMFYVEQIICAIYMWVSTVIEEWETQKKWENKIIMIILYPLYLVLLLSPIFGTIITFVYLSESECDGKLYKLAKWYNVMAICLLAYGIIICFIFCHN